MFILLKATYPFGHWGLRWEQVDLLATLKISITINAAFAKI